MQVDPATARLLDTSEDALLERLGDELLGRGHGIAPDDRSRRRDFGRRWLDRWLTAQQDAICSDPRVVALLEDADTVTAVEELALVIDVVSGLAGSPPVATVAVIVVKRGLARFCTT